MKKIIVISGTPGTGKSSVAQLLSKKLSVPVIDINREVIENNFFSMDPERDTKIADIERLKSHLIRKIKGIKTDYLIIEGHYADIIPDKYIFIAIILRTHPEILKKRLEQKKYSPKKILENLQAEILGDCVYHALKSYGDNKVYELDNSELSIDEVVKILIPLVKKNKIEPQIGKIDWLGLLEKNRKLSKYFK